MPNLPGWTPLPRPMTKWLRSYSGEGDIRPDEVKFILTGNPERDAMNYGGWFGPSWGAPVCDPDRHKPTPVGKECPECSVAIKEGDQGMLIPYAGTPPDLLAYHRICFMRTVIPCGMWSEEMKQNMPPRWAKHMAEHHAQ